jgi:hypothetical protein
MYMYSGHIKHSYYYQTVIRKRVSHLGWATTLYLYVVCIYGAICIYFFKHNILLFCPKVLSFFLLERVVRGSPPAIIRQYLGQIQLINNYIDFDFIYTKGIWFMVITLLRMIMGMAF